MKLDLGVGQGRLLSNTLFQNDIRGPISCDFFRHVGIKVEENGKVININADD